eukprot:TRINITY_DN2545_c0_g1_i1.p1 TRINITY_DN2545_c0_g1~~TRINITY_DN2545_c0_g1_i1.p1  ORF type:complete len:245 (-),score=66.38 TRINITY_DN2545_c0_g1_i1:162-896(-)
MGNPKIMRKGLLISFLLCVVIGLALTSHITPVEESQKQTNSLSQFQSNSKAKTKFFGAIFRLIFTVTRVIIKAVARNGKSIARVVKRKSSLGKKLFRRFGSNRQVKFYKGGVVKVLRKGVVRKFKARGGMKKLLNKVTRVVKKQAKKVMKKSKKGKRRSSKRRSSKRRNKRNKRQKNRRRRNRRNRRKNRKCRRGIGRANRRVRNLRTRLSRLRRQIRKIKQLIRETEQITQTSSEETREETSQ